jgi:hypothetical protein
MAKEFGARAAGAINPERVAARVLERLRTQPAERRAPIRRWLAAAPRALRVAATLALLLAGGLVLRRALVGPDQPLAVVVPLLPELSEDELHEVLDSMAFEAPLPEDLAVGLTDLTESQLQELLRRMEG